MSFCIASASGSHDVGQLFVVNGRNLHAPGLGAVARTGEFQKGTSQPQFAVVEELIAEIFLHIASFLVSKSGKEGRGEGFCPDGTVSNEGTQRGAVLRRPVPAQICRIRRQCDS